MNTHVADRLNRILADSLVFEQKMHHFHWTVRGPQFFQLHAKFEDLYDRWGELVDELAERVLQIGGRPVATLAEALKLATLKEQPEQLDERAMLAETRADLQKQLEAWRQTITACEQAGDRVSANMIDDVCAETEKTMWMLGAWLGK